MHEILGPLPPGVALDAACGTGRYTEYLAGRGHQVIGVDSSPDMLAHARTRVPNADLRQGDLHLRRYRTTTSTSSCARWR